jgi:hypothetical protein
MLRGWHLEDFHAPAHPEHSNSGIKDKDRSSTDFSLQLFLKNKLPDAPDCIKSDVSKSTTCFDTS